MSIAAVASIAQSAIPGLGARQTSPAYGLAFRFTVKIDQLNLGSWQACSGLKVDFKPTETKAGGNYLGSQYLPGELVYPKVVLKRATVAKDSQTLQAWLADHAQKWVSGENADGRPSTGVITLYDSNDDPVMWWQLSGVRPAAWSGPDLDATTSKVAIETLELVHSGFLVGTGKPPTGGTGDGAGAKPLTLTANNSTVTFRFPPTEIVVQKTQQQQGLVQRATHVSATGQTAQTDGSPLEANTNRPNVTTYKLSNLVLVGPKTKQDVELLTRWATRIPGGAKGGPTLPTLQLNWGTGFSNVKVQLQSLTVSYTRFSSDGAPIRAKVGLTLEEPPKPVIGQHRAAKGSAVRRPGATNPSSGGLPGRAAHLVVQSDTLPGIAERTYADAGRWRAIAEANGLDDPLRVGAGTRLMLPSPEEVGA